MKKKIFVIGTFDTKGTELFYIRDSIIAQGMDVITADVSALYENSSEAVSPADIAPENIAAFHPEKLDIKNIFHEDRGLAISEILRCLEKFVLSRKDIAGVIGVGGTGGSSLLAPGMRTLRVGVPKLLVSTVASGNTRPYVDAADLTMMYSVADIAGLNAITSEVLLNAANAITGMCKYKTVSSPKLSSTRKLALGMTMFGVTTKCVTAVRKALENDYDCLVFHATGAGGRAMEKLAADRQLAGVLDMTTTEIADYLCGGVFSAGAERLDSIINSKIPYVCSLGALDMVNFGSIDTVPEKYEQRQLYKHNPQVTLMRTNIEENRVIGKWLAEKLNQCEGPLRLLIPEKGVSAISIEGQPFYNPEADNALFNALKEEFCETKQRKLISLPLAINDAAFSSEIVENFIGLIK